MISQHRHTGSYVSKLSNKLRRKLDMLSSRGEFSGSQGRALHFLLAQKEDVFQKDVEEEFSIRPSTATELLKQMEKSGLIVRKRQMDVQEDADDGQGDGDRCRIDHL